MAEQFDIRSIRKLADEALLDAVEDNRNEMYQLRLQLANGELTNPNLIKLNRRNLAKLKTVLGERQSAHASSNQKGK